MTLLPELQDGSTLASFNMNLHLDESRSMESTVLTDQQKSQEVTDFIIQILEYIALFSCEMIG